MECNKDEAIRVRDIAELKFAKEDLVGAKKFILKALQLYPCLDGVIQLSAVLDVHIAAQVKVGITEPEPDYYGILQVEPQSDASTIKTQYHKLALLVHPDKHNEPVKEKASAAFILVKEAWDVLSNKETRFQHDLKRREKSTAKEPPKPAYSTHQPQEQDAKRAGTRRANPQPQPMPRKQEPTKATYSANQPRHKAAAQPTPAPSAQASQAPREYTFSAPASPPPGAQVPQAPYTFWTPTSPATGTQAFQAPNTFWTGCPFCRMQYQCMRIFLNNQVVCQNCHFSFPANDISVHPATGASAFVWLPELWGNNNPSSAASWVNMLMNKNYLAPAYGASTNGTFRNDLLSIFNSANPYGGYGSNLPLALVGLGILLSAMNL